MTDHTPRGRRLARWGAVLGLALVVDAFAVWVLWHSLLTDAFGRPSITTAIKDYYLGDQFAYLGIAANVEAGRSAFVEPYTATGSSIYPSGYFWVVGMFARAFGTSVFGAWNVVGVLVDLALFVTGGAVAWGLTRKPWSWVLGAVPVLIGTFQYWTIGSWRAIYGAHAVLWPVAATLFSPGAEPAALLLAALAVTALTFETRVVDRARLPLAAGAGVAVGLALSVHTYVAILAATVAGLWFFVRSCQLAASRAARGGLLATVVVAAGLVAIVPESFPILRVVVVIAAGLGSSLIGQVARSRMHRTLLAFAGAVGLVAAPMLVRIASQVGDRSSFLYLRQASGVATDLSLPVVPVLVHSVPALLLAAGCLAHHLRRRSSPGAAVDDGWSAALLALLAGGALLVTNESWGLQQEPYRFLPYTQFLLAMFALPWLLLAPLGRLGPTLLVRGVAVGAAAATIPTTLLFARETPAILQSPPAEQAAYRRVAEVLPDDGLALLDSCLPRGAFKALTGARVAGMNEGLALPEHADVLRDVLGRQRGGELADGERLAAADIRAFVALDGCPGPAEAALASRFGPPRRTVALTPPPVCGLAPLQLRIYHRAVDEQGEAITWDPAPATPGAPAHPWAPCSLSGLRSDVG